MGEGSDIVFQLQPTPWTHPPTTDIPPFESRLGKRLKIDSKTTEKRLEIDLGGGSVVVGDESGEWAVAEKQCY